MLKQDAISLLNVSEKVFDQYVKERQIRRVTLNNGRYSYNEEDINNLLKLRKKKSKAQVDVIEINNNIMAGLLFTISSFDIIEIVCSRETAEVIKQLKIIIKDDKEIQITIKD